MLLALRQESVYPVTQQMTLDSFSKEIVSRFLDTMKVMLKLQYHVLRLDVLIVQHLDVSLVHQDTTKGGTTAT